MRIEHGAYFSRIVREQLFAPSVSERPLIGASIELIPLIVDSGRVAPIEREGGVSSATLLRRFGLTRGWRERRTADSVPCFFTPDAATISFQPGGQIEVAAPGCASIDELLAILHRTLEPLHDVARRNRIDLYACGIDPLNNILDVPLQIETEHHAKLSTYLGTLGPSGARLLRQGAGLTIRIDSGRDPASRWRLLSDLAPYLTAMFAASRRYAGLDSGLQSYRAYCRRSLDASRTSEDDPRDSYVEFALDTIDPMRRRADGRYVPYRDWIATGEWSEKGWEQHLSTLFPEVRPCGHLELCAIDAIPLRWLAAPIVLACGLVYDEETVEEASALVAGTDEAVLWRAAGLGLQDDGVAGIARDLAELGLRGARSLGPSYVSAAQIAVAREFCEQYTKRHRSLADDASTPALRPASVPRLVVIGGAFGFG